MNTDDRMVPLLGGTLHNFSDIHCLCRDYVTPSRPGARCEACAKAETYGRHE